MTHTYKVDNTLTCVIYNDGVEVSKVGPWADTESADDFGKDLVRVYNDKTINVNNAVYPNELRPRPVLDTEINPNEPKAVTGASTPTA